MGGINQEHKQQIEEKLNEEGKTQLNKLSKLQLLQVAKQTRKLYNNLCINCKSKMIKDPSNTRNIDDFCELCQDDYNIKCVFTKLQDIFQKIK